ncbi:MAG: hypothetical protein U0136_06705 [Bdellovibrionota bacterium]
MNLRPVRKKSCAKVIAAFACLIAPFFSAPQANAEIVTSTLSIEKLIEMISQLRILDMMKGDMAGAEQCQHLLDQLFEQLAAAGESTATDIAIDATIAEQQALVAAELATAEAAAAAGTSLGVLAGIGIAGGVIATGAIDYAMNGEMVWNEAGMGTWVENGGVGAGSPIGSATSVNPVESNGTSTAYPAGVDVSLVYANCWSAIGPTVVSAGGYWGYGAVTCAQVTDASSPFYPQCQSLANTCVQNTLSSLSGSGS